MTGRHRTVFVGATDHYPALDIRHLRRAGIVGAGAIAGASLRLTFGLQRMLDVHVAIDTLDLVLCMSVNPGWGGQSFIPGSVDKLTRMRAALPERVALEVDGGINTDTAGAVSGAGAGLLVTGSAVFGSDDPAAAYAAISAAAGF